MNSALQQVIQVSGGMNRQGMLGEAGSRGNIARHLARQLELLVRRGRQQGNQGAVIDAASRLAPLTGRVWTAKDDPVVRSDATKQLPRSRIECIVERHRHQPVYSLPVL